jgi:hypothetical protein
LGLDRRRRKDRGDGGVSRRTHGTPSDCLAPVPALRRRRPRERRPRQDYQPNARSGRPSAVTGGRMFFHSATPPGPQSFGKEGNGPDAVVRARCRRPRQSRGNHYRIPASAASYGLYRNYRRAKPDNRHRGGWRAVDAGPLARARELEALGYLPMALQQPLGTGFSSAVKVLA